jgi:ribosomal protein L40E
VFAASDPNLMIGGLTVGGLVIAGLWQLIVWVRDAPATPDPWDAEVEQKLSEPEAVEVCHRCFTEQPDNAWFCARCGSAVGPYNNLMPYVCIFSQGEVFRNGVEGRVRPNSWTTIGYLFYSLANYNFFAPIYWLSFFKNQQRLKAEQLSQPEVIGEPPP